MTSTNNTRLLLLLVLSTLTILLNPTIAAPQPRVTTCAPTGCSNEICAPNPVVSPCTFSPAHLCYTTTTTTCQADPTSPTGCGWTQPNDLAVCLANAKAGVAPSGGWVAPTNATVVGTCSITGCDMGVCADVVIMSACVERKPADGCYSAVKAVCEPQSTAGGKCGWTQTDGLKACMSGVALGTGAGPTGSGATDAAGLGP